MSKLKIIRANRTWSHGLDCVGYGAGLHSSRGVGELAAWFRDSEGNLLGIGQPLR